MKSPLNRKAICKEYGIGTTKRDELLKGFLRVAGEKDFILDGRILIVDREAFEDYWRNKR